MALIKLYESASAVPLYGTEVWGGIFSAGGFYQRRYDCVAFDNGAFQSVYKLFRDGTMLRTCAGTGHLYSYDYELDLRFVHEYGGAANYYVDPIGMRANPSRPARFTNTGYGFERLIVWRGSAYRINGALVTKCDMAGVTQGTFTVTGSINPFNADTWAITDDGILVVVDDDNGSYGVVRFYNMYTLTALHTSVIDRARRTFIDTTHNNIWSINLATGRLQTWSFDVAPQNFTSITSSGNHSRYRQDTLSVTLRGSVNEPVPNWPVKWTLSTSEGHLRDEVLITDSAGLTSNLYCGPGATDYVGGSQTITVETGY